MDEQRQQAKWDKRYQGSTRVPDAARVVSENLHLLPRQGDALDLACGLGANALALAAQGLRTSAWDLSPLAIQKLEAQAKAAGLEIAAEARNVVSSPPTPESFDVIVVAHFLERSLAQSLIRALRREGLLLYQTFTRARVSDTGPKNPDYRLADNELLSTFVPPLALRVYREEGTLGDVRAGFRDLAMLVAQRVL